jgi:NAD+ synthase (glutamine-hydrolysing)
MKVALAQLNYLPGDVSGNSRKIISSVDHARSRGADLIVFSEMAVTG